MPMVRTVFQPDAPREVSEHEAAQLEREGLLLPLEEESVPAPAAPATPAGPASNAAAEPTAPAAPEPASKPAKEARPGGSEAQ